MRLQKYSILLMCCLPCVSIAQRAEKAAVKATIHRFFEGLEKGDTVALKSACMPDMLLQSYILTKEGQWVLRTQPYADLLKAVARPHTDTYDEQIKFKSVEVEAALASVWTPYRFVLNGKLSHCGTNSFQLVRRPDGWKIQYIIDTRRRDCAE